MPARAAARSRTEVASPLEMSLPALFLLFLPIEWRPDVADTDVAEVLIDRVAESRELVVGVLVYVPDEAEPRFGVRVLIEFDFLSGLSSSGEPVCTSSPEVMGVPWRSASTEVSAIPSPTT